MEDLLRRLKTKRDEAFRNAKAIADGAEAEKRDLTTRESSDFDAHMATVRQLDERITEVLEAREREEHLSEARAPYRSVLFGQEQPMSDDISGARSGVPIMPTYSEYRQQEQRALAEGTGGAGGFLVPDEYSRSWFDMLRAQSVVLGANPVILEATSDVLRLPKVASGTVVSMTAENATIAQGDPTFGEVVLTPRKAAALTLVSNEVLEDSAPSVREVLARDHLAQVALLLDAQMLAGNGTAPNMRGIRNFTGASVTSLGANGATPTLDDFASALQRLQAANAGARPVWFMHSRTYGTVRKIKDGQNRYQLSPDPSQDSPMSLFGVPISISNQISIAESVGTNNDNSYVILADMNQLAVAQRKAITVEYSRDFAFSSDQTAVRTVARFDCQPINVAGFEIITGVRA